MTKKADEKPRRRYSVTFTPGTGKGLDKSLGRIAPEGMSEARFREIVKIGILLSEQGAIAAPDESGELALMFPGPGMEHAR